MKNNVTVEMMQIIVSTKEVALSCNISRAIQLDATVIPPDWVALREALLLCCRSMFRRAPRSVSSKTGNVCIKNLAPALETHAILYMGSQTA